WKCACPAFTPNNDAGPLRIESFRVGSYSKPGLQEAVVGTSGCEYGASSSQSCRGYVFLRRRSDAYEPVFYKRGALGECTAIQSLEGRQRLVCHVHRGHMGVYPHEFRLLSFTQRRRGSPRTRSSSSHSPPTQRLRPRWPSVLQGSSFC